METISQKGRLKQRVSTLNYPLIFALFAISAGIFVLIGWSLDIQFFKSVLPNLPIMKPNTALGIILCGLSILYLSGNFRHVLLNYLIIFLAFLIFLVSLLTLTEYLFQIDFGIQQLLFYDKAIINPGRISPTSSFCFICLAISMYFMLPGKNIELKMPIVSGLNATIILLSGLIFLSYIPNLWFHFKIFNYTDIGIHTSFLFVLLGLSFLIMIKKKDHLGWTLNATITGGCISILISLLLISFAYNNFIHEIKKNNETIIQSQTLVIALSKIILSLDYITLNQQMHSITNGNVFLENLNRNQKQISNDLENVNQMIEDNPDQKKRLDRLKLAVNQKLDLTQKKTKLTNKKTFLMNEISINNQILDLLTKIFEDEESSFSIQVSKQKTLSTYAILLSPLGMYLSIALFAIGVSLVNTNLLERRKIIAKQKQLADIVESSNDGIIGKDLQSIITSWNKGAEHIFGYTANEMIGKSILTLFPEDKVPEESKITKKITSEQKIVHFDTIRKRKDGKPIYVSIAISPIKNEKNEIIGASKIVRDITEKKNLELQLRQSQKLSAIGELTGGVAHDFNNLLGVIIGNLDLLERHLSNNPEALKRINSALNAAVFGADLTKRLLTFARLQYLKPEPTLLSSPINNVIEMASQILGGNIKISSQLDSSIPPIMIDPTELESALLNLAINARDAMPNGGELIFSTKLLELDEHYLSVQCGEIKPGTYACISVIDSGVGIAPEIIDRVFEPFFTTKNRGKGTGMGLSMVYGFIKQSGGTVKIYSKVNHGTTVSLYFPISEGIKIQKIINNNKNVKFNGKVLVVDDEDDLLELTSTYLRDMGFDVFHATNGKAALTLFKQEPNITLVVTDIVMSGGMNGIELARKIRQLNKNITIVYTSGLPDKTLAEQSMNIEDALIKKPYNRNMFVSIINQVIQNKPD